MIVVLSDPSGVSEARRAAVALARRANASEEAMGRIALIATELATNLLKHAGQGELGIERFSDADGSGIALLALDTGPGIADVGQALSDGYSTAGSSGTGLGAVRRQADHFAIYTRPKGGTALLARLVLTPPGPVVAGRPAVALASLVAPYPGEEACGDGWAYAAAPAGPTLLAVDGSGHGTAAEMAATAAISAFHRHADRSCVQLIEAIHRALSSTRGAAVGVARIDPREQVVRFAGIGNITAAMAGDDGVRRMVSHNGIAGHVTSRISEFTYPYRGRPTVILHSDGLSAKWDLATYPGLAASHPGLIAGVLFRDFRRSRDDASIVVLRMKE